MYVNIYIYIYLNCNMRSSNLPGVQVDIDRHSSWGSSTNQFWVL